MIMPLSLESHHVRELAWRLNNDARVVLGTVNEHQLRAAVRTS